MQHDLFNATQQFLQAKPSYDENKRKDNSAAPLYYGVVGVTDIYNRLSDRYHVSVPELNNAYYQNVPRQQLTAGDGYGSVQQTLKQGDSVLISFAAGKLEHPLIVGQQFYTGDVARYITSLNKGTNDNIVNIQVPPLLQGEALKAMVSDEGGAVSLDPSPVSYSLDGSDISINNSNYSKKRPKLKPPARLKVRNRSKNQSVDIHTGTKVIKSNTVYTHNAGKERSISQGLQAAAHQQILDTQYNIITPFQNFLTIKDTPTGGVYQKTTAVVPGQLTVKSDGSVVEYSNNNGVSSTSPLSIPGLNAPYTNNQSINFNALNRDISKVDDLVKTAEQQARYEQEVLLPCVENIKDIWNTAQRYFNEAQSVFNNRDKYWKSIQNDFSKGVLDASVLCNLGKVTLKAAYSPLGSIEHTIEYCAPSWLTTPLLLAQSLFNLGCSNAWKTDFASAFNASLDYSATLMVCCDSNGLPNIGFNVTSALDLSSKFAISGAPIPLKDSGALPNHVQIRPDRNTIVNLKIPSIQADENISKTVIQTSVVPGQIKHEPYVKKASEVLLSAPSIILNPITGVGEPLDLPLPKYRNTFYEPVASTINLPNQIPEDIEDDQIEIASLIPEGASPEDISLFELPNNLIAYEVDSVNYSLIIPTSYDQQPLKLSSTSQYFSKSAYTDLIDRFNESSIPNAELILNSLSNLNRTKTLSSYFETLALISRKPIVCLILCLMSVYCYGDLEYNKSIYTRLTKRNLTVELEQCFTNAQNHNLTDLYLYINNYYGQNTIDFLNWSYTPLLFTNWVTTQEPQIQPLAVSLSKGTLDVFCYLLIKLFNNVDLKDYDNLYKVFISLVKEALNLPLEGANFYKSESVRVFVPESQFK